MKVLNRLLCFLVLTLGSWEQANALPDPNLREPTKITLKNNGDSDMNVAIVDKMTRDAKLLYPVNFSIRPAQTLSYEIPLGADVKEFVVRAFWPSRSQKFQKDGHTYQRLLFAFCSPRPAGGMYHFELTPSDAGGGCEAAPIEGPRH